MATYIFHGSLLPVTASRGIQYDEALRLSNEGHKVYYLYCNGQMTQCFNNYNGDKSICHICKSNLKKESSKLRRRIIFVPFQKLLKKSKLNELNNIDNHYETVDDIRDIEYKGINIGIGVLSAYISVTRNLNPKIDNHFKSFFNQTLLNSIISIEAVNNAISIFKPEHIFLYNGRFGDSRPVWQIAQKLNIPFTTLEAVYGINENFKSRYQNAVPHSVEKNGELIYQFWENSTQSLTLKTAQGKSFFERRKDALYTGDRIYVINQVKDSLPIHWNNQKHNIVIFNSSEDEFASIGYEFDKYKLFNCQIDGLQYIKEQLKDHKDINITLRIHPNLSNIQYSYARDLLNLNSDNFYVIEGDSTISSYALIDNADTVVVFGSTIGIEAVYWNKPTILLGGAIYYKLNCFYIPESPEELLKLMMTKLEPKPRLEAIKFGYFMINEEWERPTALDFRWSTTQIIIFNKKIQFGIFNWKNLLFSRRIYSIYNGIWIRMIKIFFKLKRNKGIRYSIPILENNTLKTFNNFRTIDP